MIGETSLRRLVRIVVATTVLALLSCAGAQAGDAALGKLGPEGKANYGAVAHNGKTPRISSIALKKKGKGLEARFRVRYPGVIRRGEGKGVVSLVVARRIADNRQPRGTVRKITVKRGLGGKARTVRYRLALGRRASAFLRGPGKKRRGQLLRVQAALEVDGDRDGRTDHRLRAASTLGHSNGLTKAAADNTIVLEFVNATGGRINNVSLPVMCMYDTGTEGSWVSGFNATQSATISDGGTIVLDVAANGSVGSSADFQSPIAPDQLESAWYEGLNMSLEALNEIGDGIPGLGTLDDLVAFLDGCDENSSLFMFTAAEAGDCPEATPNCHLSSTAAWLMSETTFHSAQDYYAPPIDSAFAGEIAQISPSDPWGAPSATALDILAGKWATYVDDQACSGGHKAMTGDHGFSWVLNGGGPIWQVVVYKSGADTGWSGGNPQSPWAYGNPAWSTKWTKPMCKT